MLVTTTNSIEGRPIQQYRGVVFGEIVAGVNFVKDFVAGLSDIFGGRSGTYEEELINARNGAMQEMIDRAEQMGANAIVGMKLDYEVLGSSMLMVTASGTAVVIA